MQDDAGSNLLHGWIARPASRTPDKPWVVGADDGHSVSYAELREAVGRLATFLGAQGLGRNDRVALLANNSIEHLVAYFGVMAAGATVCTVHVEMNRNQLDNIFARLKPRLVLYQEGLGLDDFLAGVAVPRLRLGRFRAAAAETLFGVLAGVAASDPQRPAGPSDDAVILFTSGTTARPKGVVLNFREFLLNVGPAAEGFGLTTDDRVYDCRPFSWASAQLLGALVPVNRGATLVLAETF
jgi:long-chain acyl-CoA synthetase